MAKYTFKLPDPDDEGYIWLSPTSKVKAASLAEALSARYTAEEMSEMMTAHADDLKRRLYYSASMSAPITQPSLDPPEIVRTASAIYPPAERRAILVAFIIFLVLLGAACILLSMAT